MFDTHEFCYRRIAVERPLRLSTRFEEAVSGLCFAPKPFNNVMCWVYEQYGDDCYEGLNDEQQNAVREKIKKDFTELKERQIKELLDTKLKQQLNAITWINPERSR